VIIQVLGERRDSQSYGVCNIRHESLFVRTRGVEGVVGSCKEVCEFS